MGTAKRTRDIGAVPSGLTADQQRFLEQVRRRLQDLSGTNGSRAGQAVTWDDLRAGGLVGGDLQIPAGGFTQDGTPDLTPPPTPAGLSAVAALTNIIITTSDPVFLVGHGYARTLVYGAKVTDQVPNPVFADAQKIHEFVGSVGSYPTDPGSHWRLWATWLSNDGVQSFTPAGPVDATTGLIDGHDLSDDLDLAAKLADGSISGSKLAVGAIDATKFANDIEPVTIVTSGTLPTTKSTNVIVFDGKLYRWNGSAYVASVASTDITGTLADAQIEALAASKVTGQLTSDQITSITAAKLTGQITSTQITDNAVTTGKLAAGAVSTAKLAAGAVTAETIASSAVTAEKINAGAVTTAKLAAGSVTASTIAADAVTADKLAANAVMADAIAANAITTAKIAAGAVSASQIAAGAVSADKLLVGTPSNLVADPNATTDAFLAAVNAASSCTVTRSSAGDFACYTPGTGNYYVRPTAVGQTAAECQAGKWIACQPGDQFYFSLKIYVTAGHSGDIRLTGRTADGASLVSINGTTTFSASTSSRTVTVSNTFTIPAGCYWCLPEIRLSGLVGTSYPKAGGIIFAKAVGSVLIADGAVTANKIAANAIVAGTAAIQDGAIVNAMIGNAAIDDAKIANLSAAKLTAGDGTIGNVLKSANYLAGSQGWIIRPNGTAEFSGVTVRGTVYATAGQIGGATIAGSYVQSSNYSESGKTGWKLDNASGTITAYKGKFFGELSAATGTFAGNLSAAGGTFKGSLSAAGGTFKGSLSAATGTFAGDLSAAGGTFSGTLTANAVNAVDTINIAGNAVSTTNAATATNTLSFNNGSERSVLSLTVNTYGGLLLINAGLLVPDPYLGSQGQIIIRLKRNGTTIKQFSVISAYVYTVGDTSVYYGWTSYLNLPPIVENVGTETRTYELTAALQNTGSGTRWSISDRAIVITEFKR